MIGNPHNNPQEAINEHIKEMIDFENQNLKQVKSFLKVFEVPKTKVSKQDLPIIESFTNLNTLFQTLRDFENSVTKIQKPTLDSLADEIKKSGLNKEFQNLNKHMPDASELRKFMLDKKNATFANSMKSTNMDIAFWFHLPFIIAAKWERFWEFVLANIPTEDPKRSAYQSCKIEFEAVDHKQVFQRTAQQSGSQLKDLRKYGKNANLDFNENLKLYACVSGDVITGSLDNVGREDAILFLFEDKLALMRTALKSVQQQNTLNIWLVPSTMFPKSQKIVDVLGTDFSFAFQPKSSVEHEMLWKNWLVIMSEKPRDYGIYQPIILDPKEQPPALDWVEINE